MARKRDRAFAAFGAGLFLLTSSALTIAVVYSAVTQKKADPAASTSTSQLNDAEKKALAAASKSKETPVQNDKLAGNPLAGFTPVDSIPQLQKIDTVPGTGAEVKAGDTVTVDYTGAVAKTGVVFQSSKDSGQPISFGLSQVIAGWSQGVPGMKVDGTRRLLIPAALAYGSNPPQGSGIPANADLVFDITLHKIGK
ncbi:MAG: putative peptidyl-prolyl cis-trans isomerase [Candidatus Saccharibacteria bacterium]|nr:putative peptidyl-prolyl cis-trans isomerase [Candidatus Saccharibacteria bacterium]